MTRRTFLGSAAAAVTAPAQSRRPPNILFILADDLGYGDVGCYGQRQIQTPVIDRLAREGTRFTQAYAGGAVCAPSRCSLMTGMHNGHARIRANGQAESWIRPEDLTVTEVLKRQGYTTGLLGKWSLGGLGTTGYPTKRGFDTWFGFFSQSHAHNYYPELLLEQDHEIRLKGNTGNSRKDYVTDLFTDRAMDFLKQNRERPFFLNLAYTAPHTDNEWARDTGNGQTVPADKPYSGRDWPQVEKNFAAMVTGLDERIGAVLARLRELGLDENTLVLFTSDNGPHNAGGHSYKFFQSAGPLRGFKGDLYEGGIRVPSIVRWPGRVQAGRTSEYPWAFCDFMPTAIELAGGSAPRGIDGISVLPEILGKSQRAHPHFYWEQYRRKAMAQAIREGEWKAIRQTETAATELYNLKDDPAEAHDVAAEHLEVAKRLTAHFTASRFECAPCRKLGEGE